VQKGASAGEIMKVWDLLFRGHMTQTLLGKKKSKGGGWEGPNDQAPKKDRPLLHVKTLLPRGRVIRKKEEKGDL